MNITENQKKKIIIYLLIAIFLFALFIISDSLSRKDEKSNIEEPSDSHIELSKTEKEPFWVEGKYTDEFGNETSVRFLKNSEFFSGTFSNSATEGSLLYASVYIEDKDITIKLYEYGDNLVKQYQTTEYNVKFLDENGKKHSFVGKMYSDRIYLPDKSLIELLKTNSVIKCYISENNTYGYNSTYLFTIEAKDFVSAYENFN